MTQQASIIAKNTIDNIVEIWVVNTSTGRGITGIAFGSILLRAWERGQAGGAVSVVPVLGTIDTWVDNGWIEVDAVNLQGMYQYSIPNAILQANTSQVDILFDVNVVNAEDVLMEITLTAVPIDTGVQIAPNGWDALAIEGLTAKQAIQLMASVLCGETTGAETSKTIFKALDDNTTQRLTSESTDETNRDVVEVFI